MNLFYSEVEEEKLHKNFLAIREDSYIKNVLNDWVQGFVDRDNKFVTEFQTTFNSSFWELYLFACFKELKFNVDFRYQSPDFYIKTENNKEFFVEAVTASNPQDGLPEWERESVLSDSELFNRYTEYDSIIELATIRLMQALTFKFNKFITEYSQKEYCKDKPFVIAVAPFEQPFFFTQNTNAIRRLLYTFDIPEYEDIDGERFVFGNKKVKAVKKPNGTELPLGLFLDPKYEGISAVLFSNTATSGKARVLSEDNRFILVAFEKYNDYGLDKIKGVEEKKIYKESLIEGMNIFHNPYAKHKLEIEELRHPDIVHHFYDPDEEEFYTKIKHEALFHRMVFIARNGHLLTKRDKEKFKKDFIKKVFKNTPM